MPIIKCPQCGKEQLIVDGKRKNCRRCNTPLSTITPKPAKPLKFSAAQLVEQFPKAVDEIKELAAAEAVEAFKATFSGEGESGPSAELMAEHFPALVTEIADGAAEAATEAAKSEFDAEMKNVTDLVAVNAKEAKAAADEAQVAAVEKAIAGIGKLSVKAFAEKFPQLSEKIANAAKKEANS